MLHKNSAFWKEYPVFMNYLEQQLVHPVQSPACWLSPSEEYSCHLPNKKAKKGIDT
jgi:hypothetical protein